jgi:hypothetical protein
MDIEKLREFEQMADERASVVCFTGVGNDVPDKNWHDQFLIEFSKLIITYTKEACARVCDRAIGDKIDETAIMCANAIRALEVK